MSLETQRSFVESRLASFMAANYPTTPVAYPNVPFNQPDGPFVELGGGDGQSFRANLGSQYTVRHLGVLTLSVHVPENTGMVFANGLSQALGDHFQERDHTLSDGARLTFRAAGPRPQKGQKKGFATVMVTIPYFRDERQA